MPFLPMHHRHYKTWRELKESNGTWDYEEESPLRLILNCNDTFGWALAYGYDITDCADMAMEIYEKYGWSTLMTWVTIREEIDYDDSITPYYDRDYPGWREKHEADKLMLKELGYV